jgi:hypothetical protein
MFGLTISPSACPRSATNAAPTQVRQPRKLPLRGGRGRGHDAPRGIRWLSTTTKSIEEIATTILQEVRPERLVY